LAFYDNIPIVLFILLLYNTVSLSSNGLSSRLNWSVFQAGNRPCGREFKGRKSQKQEVCDEKQTCFRNDSNGTPQLSANPFIGGIWLDWDTNVNYKFTETGGAKVYSTAGTTTFNVAGTYEFVQTTTYGCVFCTRTGQAKAWPH
jgi:hypothetical protein